MKLYKYRKFNPSDPIDQQKAIELLNENSWHSLPSKFKDPIDCKPKININIEISEKSKRIVHHLMGSNSIMFAPNKIINAFSNGNLNKMTFDIRKNVGVACFASENSNYKNHYLWKEYCDGFDGVVFEYDIYEEHMKEIFLFEQIDYLPNKKLEKINRNDVYLFDEELDRAKRLLKTYFFQKQEKYNKEDEIRSIILLDKNHNSYGKNIKLGNLSKIIFGPEISQQTKDFIISENSKRLNVNCYDSKFDNNGNVI